MVIIMALVNFLLFVVLVAFVAMAAIVVLKHVIESRKSARPVVVEKNIAVPDPSPGVVFRHDEERKKCASCGCEIDDAKHCPYCGARAR